MSARVALPRTKVAQDTAHGVYSRNQSQSYPQVAGVCSLDVLPFLNAASSSGALRIDGDFPVQRGKHPHAQVRKR